MNDFVGLPLLDRFGNRAGWTLVDVGDLDRLLPFRWYSDGRYAATTTQGTRVRLHRLVMGDPAGAEIDHCNGDRLDNRKSNLRIVSHAENLRNVPSQTGTSEHRGVYWDSGKSRWGAQAKFLGNYTFLGYFGKESDAAQAVRAFWLSKDPHSFGMVDGALARREVAS